MCGGGGDPKIKETPEQKELARIAVERWNKYKEMYLPVEQEYFDLVEKMDQKSTQKRAAGTAAVNVESAFADAIQNDVAMMTSQGSGVDPSSGKFQSAVADHAERKGAARSENMSMTEQAVKDNYIKGLQSIVAMGNNQASEAISGMGEVAQRSSDVARSEAVSDFRKDQGDEAAVGMVAGAGYGAYTNRDSAQ